MTPDVDFNAAVQVNRAQKIPKKNQVGTHTDVEYTNIPTIPTQIN